MSYREAYKDYTIQVDDIKDKKTEKMLSIWADPNTPLLIRRIIAVENKDGIEVGQALIDEYM